MPLLETSLADLARALETGAITARSLVEHAAARHTRYGEELHAYRRFDADAALESATEIDEARRKGGRPHGLDGIPISVKDLYGVRGMDTFAGTARRLPEEWEAEGFLVQALREQGGVFVGKTHTVELAFGGVGTNPHWGTPVNPWDATAARIPGGSSCGAGVSLAEGSALVALGTDTGGSIRIPASLTGVVGHKTTRGRWPTTGVVPLSSTLDTVGVLTRTVADAIYVFGSVDPGGPGGLELQSQLRRHDGVRGLRIGIPQSSIWDEAQPDIVNVTWDALAELERAGAILVDIEGALFDRGTDGYFDSGLVAVECAAFLDRSLPDWWELLHPSVGARVQPGSGVPLARYEQALAERLAGVAEAPRWLADVDVAAVPTVPITPPPIWDVADQERYVLTNRACLRATTPVSYLDLCAITLPSGLDGTGMPVGLQLFARGGEDTHVLSVGAAVERVLGTAAERLGRPPRTRPQDSNA